jgi:hypothetical protein
MFLRPTTSRPSSAARTFPTDAALRHAGLRDLLGRVAGFYRDERASVREQNARCEACSASSFLRPRIRAKRPPASRSSVRGQQLARASTRDMAASGRAEISARGLDRVAARWRRRPRPGRGGDALDMAC